MKRKSRGQTLVEFALVFPLIMFFLFATIDYGYYIYAWSEIQFAARRGAEQASLNQPREVQSSYSALDYAGDPCLQEIVAEMQKSGWINAKTKPDLTQLTLHYYDSAAAVTPLSAASANPKKIGNVVEVRLDKAIAPLTPVAETFNGGDDFHFVAISRRTIVSNGPLINAVVDNRDYEHCIIVP